MSTSRMNAFRPVAAAALLVLTLSACSVDDAVDDATSSSATAQDDVVSELGIEVDEDAAVLVPDGVADDGITVATGATNPPMTFVAEDGSTLTGLDIDMARAIGATLGVETEVTNVGFDTIIPGLASGRYTMALSSIGVTRERQEAVDFVSYYNGGQGFLVASDSGLEINDLEGLCGLNVSVSQGSTQQSTLTDSAGICADAGLDPYELQTYPDLNQAVLAISSGRSDVLYGSISIISYTEDQDDADAFAIAGVYRRALVGVALPKDGEMTEAVQAAVQHLIDEGTYAEILARWGLEDNAVESAEINNAEF